MKLLREHAPASVLYSGIPCTLFASTKVEDMERDVHKEHTCSFPLITLVKVGTSKFRVPEGNAMRGVFFLVDLPAESTFGHYTG